MVRFEKTFKYNSNNNYKYTFIDVLFKGIKRFQGYNITDRNIENKGFDKNIRINLNDRFLHQNEEFNHVFKDVLPELESLLIDYDE